MQLQQDLGCEVRYIGKPHPDIFHLALRKANYRGIGKRVLMVGDTLHTDILGGQSMGFDTALVTGQGASHGLELNSAIAHTGICPDFAVKAI
jgi:glycerol 3-phosphatase-2